MEREKFLGCSRIESVAEQSAEVIWGNHIALEEKVQSLGPAAELYAGSKKDKVVIYSKAAGTARVEFPRDLA